MMKKLRSRFSISVEWCVSFTETNPNFRTINEWAVGFHTWRPRLLVTIWIQFMKTRTLRIRTAQKGNWIKLAVIYHKNFSSQNDRDLNDPLKKLVHHLCVWERYEGHNSNYLFIYLVMMLIALASSYKGSKTGGPCLNQGMKCSSRGRGPSNNLYYDNTNMSFCMPHSKTSNSNIFQLFHTYHKTSHR